MALLVEDDERRHLVDVVFAQSHSAVRITEDGPAQLIRKSEFTDRIVGGVILARPRRVGRDEIKDDVASLILFCERVRDLDLLCRQRQPACTDGKDYDLAALSVEIDPPAVESGQDRLRERTNAQHQRESE